MTCEILQSLTGMKKYQMKVKQRPLVRRHTEDSSTYLGLRRSHASISEETLETKISKVANPQVSDARIPLSSGTLSSPLRALTLQESSRHESRLC